MQDWKNKILMKKKERILKTKPKGRMEICPFCNTLVFHYSKDSLKKCKCREKIRNH